jgi:anaerobic ribonucleoside-triphosphate reductase activating protein
MFGKLMSNYLRIANINTGFVDVPGQISLNLFCQGCGVKCKNCQNPKLISMRGGNKLYEEDFDLIITKYHMCNWICFLGGDATFQPEGLKYFSKLFKTKYDKKVCLYTGKLFEDIQDLIKHIDLVIDGPWQGLTVDNPNTNQRIFTYSDNKWNRISFNDLKQLGA